jgi:AcrR family transcriptional regulator
MPKPTFHNLPEDKQARIVDAALDEFAAVPFEAASVNRIVRGAGIAKGSFYQYFDDMADLYQHVVITVGAQRKEAVIRASGFERRGGLFGQLRHVMTVSLRFGLAEPKLLAASMWLRGPIAPDSALKPVHDQHQARVLRAFEAILAGGVQSGAVRADVDLAAAATLLIITLTHGLEPMMRQRFGFNLQDVVREPTLANTVDDAALEEVVDALLDVIVRGIRTDPDAGALDLDMMFTSRRDP